MRKDSNQKRNILKNNFFRIFFLILFFIMVLSLILVSNDSFTNQAKERVINDSISRLPAVAGTFYPSSNSSAMKSLDAYFSTAGEKKIDGTIRGLISPHAGWIYSGQVAAFGYKELISGDYETVIIMGPSHHVYSTKAEIPNKEFYKTPLGYVKISDKAKELLKNNLFVSDYKMEGKEHSVEVNVPFLQYIFWDFEIIPIVVGDVDPRELADALEKIIDDKTLIVASSDLSHYNTLEKAEQLDSICKNAAQKLDMDQINECDACGIIPIITLMNIAKDKGWIGELMDYGTSANITNDPSSVVGYMSVAYFEKEVKTSDQKAESALTETEKRFLLALARQTVEHYIVDGSSPIVKEEFLSESLFEKKGCFVTLNKKGDLRGCVGHILPQEELYKCIIDNAINAAVKDGRFEAVTKDELSSIKIDISVLSVPKDLSFTSGDDLKEKLRPLVDGVVLRSGIYSATYLPQVWEQIPDKEDFLKSLCAKGGMSQDCWTKTSTKVQIYQAEVFSEKDFK